MTPRTEKLRKQIFEEFKDLISKGFPQNEAVKQIARERACSDRSIYGHIKAARESAPIVQQAVAQIPETSADYEIPTIPEKKAKILLFDIETAPNRGWTWGRWQQNVIAFDAEFYLLSFAAKWAGGEMFSRCLTDYANYKPHTEDDRPLVTELWTLFDEADIIIGHNLDQFDIRMSNARFVILGLPPPSPYKTFDTKKIAKRHFRFNSNALEALAEVLGIGRKTPHVGKDLWFGWISGDAESWATMRKYNEQDVLLLEAVYNKLKPFATNHPNVSIIEDNENGCKNCGHSKMRQQGFTLTATGKAPNYQCENCGAWHRGKHIKVSDIR